MTGKSPTFIAVDPALIDGEMTVFRMGPKLLDMQACPRRYDYTVRPDIKALIDVDYSKIEQRILETIRHKQAVGIENLMKLENHQIDERTGKISSHYHRTVTLARRTNDFYIGEIVDLDSLVKLPREIAQGWVWGPRGEFTGIALPCISMSERLKSAGDPYRYQEGVIIRVPLHGRQTIDLRVRRIPRAYRAYRPPFASWWSDAQLSDFTITSFPSYHEYVELVQLDDLELGGYPKEGEYARKLKGRFMNAEVQEIASCLQAMKVETFALEQWLGMMESGSYKFGYGLLRSASDEYDPFGVMVEAFCPEWVWSTPDEAWAFEGDALMISPKKVGEWLGVSLTEQVIDAGMLEAISNFISLVTEANDSATSFEVVTSLIRRAIARMLDEQNRWSAIRERGPAPDSYGERALIGMGDRFWRR